MSVVMDMQSPATLRTCARKFRGARPFGEHDALAGLRPDDFWFFGDAEVLDFVLDADRFFHGNGLLLVCVLTAEPY
jgi:hypothetical protein